MNVLDSSIANVSIPAIAGDLGVSPGQGTWVITSFGVANAISVPLTGWLTQRFGAVRLFTMSVMLFVLTSWLCGFASSLEMLVFFRVLQGLVAGPMIPLSQTLLLSSYLALLVAIEGALAKLNLRDVVLAGYAPPPDLDAICQRLHADGRSRINHAVISVFSNEFE